MKIQNILKDLNGYFTLNKLNPSFLHFAKSDISDLKRLSKEEGEAIWMNSEPKPIGSICYGVTKKCESILFKNFIRTSYNKVP